MVDIERNVQEINMTKPVWWDLTLPRGEFLKDGRKNPYGDMTMAEIGEQLIAHGAERCVVGEEVGEDGYPHWQIRLTWKSGKDLRDCINVVPLGHWSKTLEKTRNFDYVEKGGKFWRSWETALGKCVDTELFPWQNEVRNRLRTQG